MKSRDVIKKVIGSYSSVDRLAREIFDRLPLWARYRLYYGKTFLYWAAFLRKTEYFSQEELDTVRIELLKAQLLHASLHVPYYRRVFRDYGFDPARLQNPDDVKVLPYLTKETVRENISDFVAVTVPPRKLLKFETSGSSGIPFTVYKTKESVEIYHAFQFDLLRRVGFDPTKKTVVFQWKDIQMGGKKGMNFLRYGNKLILSADLRNTGSGVMRAYYEMIRNFRPEFVSGYVTVILMMALFMKDQGLPQLSGIKAVFAHSEALYPWQKDLIEESFGARSFPSYSLHEGVLYGGGCEHSNLYHLYPQRGLAEFIEAGGGRQEIVGTGFSNFAMPFIRYRTGDIGMAGERVCSECGRQWPLITTIDGRSYDYLISGSGELVPSIISVAAGCFRNVRQFQFFQDEPGIAFLRVVKGRWYSDTDTLMLENALRKNFAGPRRDLDVRVSVTDHIPLSASGKTLRTDQRLNIRDFDYRRPGTASGTRAAHEG